MRPAPQWNKNNASGELGMSWYHFLKWWIIIAGCGAVLTTLGQISYQSALVGMSISDYISTSFKIAPYVMSVSTAFSILDSALVIAIARELFIYSPLAYKYCAYYLVSGTLCFVLLAIVAVSTPNDTTMFRTLGALMGRFLMFLPTYYYLKKRTHILADGRAIGNPIDISVYSNSAYDEMPTFDNLEEKVFCQYCGKSILISSTFCTYCGRQISSKVER